MARTGKNGQWTPDSVRRRIRAGVLLKRLQDHGLGLVEMTKTQVSAARVVLAKVIPDMRSVEHSGEVVHRHATELSDTDLTHIATRGGDRAAKAPKGPLNS